MPDKRVLVLIGLPGSGKSTWARAQGVEPLSSDELRRLIRDDATDQTIHHTVFRLVRELLRLRIQLGAELSIVDATNLLARHRRPYIKIAEWFGARCEAVYFNVPAEVCLKRNSARSRNVPESAIRAMAARLEPPSFDEGFMAITEVSTDGEQTARQRPAAATIRP